MIKTYTSLLSMPFEGSWLSKIEANLSHNFLIDLDYLPQMTVCP